VQLVCWSDGAGAKIFHWGDAPPQKRKVTCPLASTLQFLAQHTPIRIRTQADEALLAAGVRIGHRECSWILERKCRIGELDSVPAEVGLRLGRVPFMLSEWLGVVAQQSCRQDLGTAS